jgi:serine protease Do
MNNKFLPAAIVALCIGVSASAQTTDKTPSSKDKKSHDETITIRKKGDSKEKTTIVIDGDKITINGKPIEELKDADIEILRDKALADIMPRMKRLAPMGGMKMFNGDLLGGNRAFLGVSSEKTEQGAKISSVEKESAAEKAGLKKDDIITKIGDTKIKGSDDLYEAIGKHEPEDKVTITYLRDGKEATATATLGKGSSANMKVFNFNNRDFNFDMPELRKLPRMNDMDVRFNRKPRIGLEIQDVEEGKGAKILDVDSDSPAAKAGLQKDDIISEMDGKAIASVDDLRASLKDLKEGDSIKITYSRAGKTQTADLKLPKKLKTAEL